MKVNYSGCALCDSTWGNLWAEVDGERLFFCCDLCLRQFSELIERVKTETGWPRVDSVEVAGDRRGRTCRAARRGAFYTCEFASNAEGLLWRFVSRDATPERRT